MAAHEPSPVGEVDDQWERRRQTAMTYSLELERSKELLNDPMMKLKLVPLSSRCEKKAVAGSHGASLLPIYLLFVSC